jgi:hypothetical protein
MVVSDRAERLRAREASCKEAHTKGCEGVRGTMRVLSEAEVKYSPTAPLLTKGGEREVSIVTTRRHDDNKRSTTH